MVLLLVIQYRHKKQCTNCQDHKEMKRLLKQKLKDQLYKEQAKPQETKEVELLAEAVGIFIGKWCRQGRIIH